MRTTILIFSAFSFITAAAQEASWRYADATQLWRLSDNAAGLSLDIDSRADSAAYNRGYALFDLSHSEGTYHRVQEGGTTNQLAFRTERYQTIGRYLVGYGRFDFNLDHTKDRAWCDVMRPYNANPFIPASSVYGTYETQAFDFTGAIGTVALGGWRLGVKLDFKAGDLSRLRDPRSRAQLLDYRLAPAVTRTFGRHTLGLSANYHRRKEKIPGVETVQNDPNLAYYLLSGMEAASGSVGAYKGFEREWVDHRFGGELTYAYHGDTQHSLLSLTMERGEEYAYGQYKYEPGRFTDFRYGVSLRNRFSGGSTVHQFDIAVGYEQAFADEYRQKLLQEKDPQTGLTSYSYTTQMVYKKRYQVDVLDIDMLYRAHFVKQGRERAYAGLHIRMDDQQNKHLLPVSLAAHGGTLAMAEGGVLVARRLWVDAAAGGYLSQMATLSLADATTPYAKQVLLPDMQYYKASYWRGRLQLTYEFPLTIKGYTSQWFVRAYGDYLHTDNHLDAKCLGISIGLFN